MLWTNTCGWVAVPVTNGAHKVVGNTLFCEFYTCYIYMYIHVHVLGVPYTPSSPGLQSATYNNNSIIIYNNYNRIRSKHHHRHHLAHSSEAPA